MPKYGSFGDGPIYTMNPYRRPGFFPRVDQLMWDASIARQTSEKHAELASVTAVPEPETYAMLLAGLGLMGLVARRKAGRI